MEIISYNHELEYANLLFSKLFRNIKIQKFYKNTMTYVNVNCVIGNRWRIFKNMENPEKLATYTFPMIVISRRGLQVEASRIANLHNEVKWQGSAKDHKYDLMTPVPIAISYDVTIISKDQATNDMIMSNFIPFFNQDVFVASLHPKFTNVAFKNQVIMENNITEEHPEELNGTDDDFVVNTCTFIFKTFLFGGKDKRAAGPNSGPPDDEGGDTPTSGDVIYDGFVPIIKSIMLDAHAVPYKDPAYSKYMLCTVTVPRLSAVSAYNEDLKKIEYKYAVDENGNKITCNKTLSIYVRNKDYDPYLYFTIDKYFAELDAGMIPQDVDTLRWYIDESTDIFKLDRRTSYTIPSGLSDVISVDAPSAGLCVDYPGEMWENKLNPLSGFKYYDKISSEYVPINAPGYSGYVPESFH